MMTDQTTIVVAYMFAGQAGPLLVCLACRKKYVREDAPLVALRDLDEAPIEAGTTCGLCRLVLSAEEEGGAG